MSNFECKIEKRGDVSVVVYKDGSCHPANGTELWLWNQWQAAVEATKAAMKSDDALCKECKDIGRNGEHSWYCRKCGDPLQAIRETEVP